MASKEIESSTVLDLLYSDINDGGRNQLLNREHSDFAGGSALLGRLALNYYNIIALSILLIISVFKRMKLKDISKSL
ncbi:MAG: hypothetical protein GX074_05350, partial [Erysipelothrix sp.]|nr:hypothetical protein [Erysipelothrix sp.]